MAMRWVFCLKPFDGYCPLSPMRPVALLKDSSLVSAVSLSELMRVGGEIATSKGSPTTVYLGVALLLPLHDPAADLDRATPGREVSAESVAHVVPKEPPPMPETNAPLLALNGPVQILRRPERAAATSP